MEQLEVKDCHQLYYLESKKGIGDFGWGKAAFLGAGAGLTALPFLGGDDPEEEIIDDWPVTLVPSYC